MNQNEIRAWQARWFAVNAQREAEVRGMSAMDKARQVSIMMQTRLSPVMTRKREAEVAEIRRRWAKLREAYDRPQ
jgi:hypothetical protein